MATTKATTTIWSGVTNAAGATTTSAAVDITTGYGAEVHAKITNGATGPTVACAITIETSPDNSNWFAYGGTFVSGSTTNSDVQSNTTALDPAVKYVRLKATGNTVQPVTIDAYTVNITAI